MSLNVLCLYTMLQIQNSYDAILGLPYVKQYQCVCVCVCSTFHICSLEEYGCWAGQMLCVKACGELSEFAYG